MQELKLSEHELEKLHRLIHTIQGGDLWDLDKIQIGNMSVERISCAFKNYKLSIDQTE